MDPHLDLRLRFENRKKHLLRALEGNPGDTQGRSILSLIFFNEGNRGDALAEATRVLDEEPGNALASYVLSLLTQNEDPTKSLQLINRAISVDPSDPLYYGHLAHLQFSNRGLFFRRAGIRKTLEASERGLLIEPEHSYCLTMRALALCHLGRLKQAIEAFETLLAKHPSDKKLHRILLFLYVITFRFRKAKILFKDRKSSPGRQT